MPIMGRIAPSGVAGALFSSVQQRLLGTLYGRVDQDFSVSDLIRLANSGSGAVQRELSRLARSDLVVVSRIGNQKRYRANKVSPIYRELRQIVLKTIGLAGPLGRALKPFGQRVQAAFVYGSIARGEDTAGSDVDLMVVGNDLSYGEVYSAVENVERQIGRRVNPTVTSREEWVRKLKAKNAFFAKVSDQPKLFVVGSENDLDRA